MAFAVKKAHVVYNNNNEDIGEISAEDIARKWFQATKRPIEDISNEIVKEIDEALKGSRCNSSEKISHYIRLALTMTPVIEDAVIDYDDTLRLIYTMTQPEYKDLAEDRYSSFNTTFIHYTQPEEIQERLAEVCESFGVENFEDVEDKAQESLFSLCFLPEKTYHHVLDTVESLDDETFNMDIEDLVSLLVFKKEKTPTLFVKRDYNKTSQLSNTGYEKGRSEEDTLASASMEVDILASAMIDQGYPLKDVFAVHSDVPEGYWEDVVEHVYNDENSGDPEDAYDFLVEKYHFHPQERTIP